MDNEQTVRPVPAPRRLYPELRKSEYENVAVELINKNLNIKSENLQNNANNNEKVPNNKVFLLYPTLPEGDDDITPTNNNNKSILTETNDLYGPNANENVPTYASPTPKPAPRPRKPQNNEIQNYENTVIVPASPGPGGQQQSFNILDSSGGAINKISNESAIQVTRRAPELPPKTYLNSEREMERRRRYSISSEVSTTSSYHQRDADLKDINFKRDKLNKSSMSFNSSISSLADSIDSSDNSKYKSPSPGDLLKSLGSTSKLLTESIGERVASKAKGAKHKLDKNLKSSSEALSSIGAGTTSRLKKLGANFTLTKKDKTATAEFHMDRPQTLPPNDQVFNGITFTSPLSNKAKGMYDLRQQQEDFDNSYEVPRSVRVIKTEEDKENELLQPPSYNEVIKTSSNSSLTTTSHENTPVLSKRQIATNPLALEAANKVLHKRSQNTLSADSSDTNPLALEAANKVLLKRSQNSLSADSSETLNSRDSMDLPSPPMPSIPAPVLPPDFANNSNEPAYGKLNPVQPPARHKRRKNYEDIQLRRELPENNIANLRPNIDSAELHAMNVAAAEAEREESLILREKLLEEEKKTPQPDRSDSWEYYEDQDNASTSSSNDVDPIYANQDVTYGNVFEMATSNNDILTPRNALVQISEEESADEADLGAVGGCTAAKPSKDIIQEFDPLMHKRGTTLKCNDKSNQLLLLEYLLEEDTYGSINDQGCTKSDDDISMCTSEEDNTHMVVSNSETSAAATTTSTGSVKVLPTPNLQEQKQLEKPSTSAKPMQIVHQNAHLLSDSRENMLEDDFEARVKPYLSRVDENPTSSSNRVDLSKPPSLQKRSQWFVSDDDHQQQQQQKQCNSPKSRANPFNKLNIEDGESPPSYLEAIGECPSDKNTDTAQQKHSSTSQGTAAARFMNNTKNVFSNVKFHVDALKRKASFKTQQKSCDVKVTLQMIPRPSLSPLLVRYEGPLIRFPSGVVEDILKEMQNRKAILRDRQFQTFLDQEMKTPKEAIPLEHITTLQCVSNSRVTDNSTRFYCFEITTSVPKNGSGGSSSSSSGQQLSNPNLIITSASAGNVKYQRSCHLYGVGKESERGIWMQKLLESLTNVVPVKYTCQYYRAGWCYLKNSITSEWSGTWLVLKKTQRRLIFVTEATGNVEKVDLRKARCIVLKDSDDTVKNLHVENGPMLMIDAPPFTVYMIMSTPRETKIWRHIIREVAHNNGFTLADQQLTKFNVPVIVDKCINFVYIHGSMSEGIYRKSGSENSILKLMSAFRSDAFNVEITRNEYNEHDVANVLKRFMRDLPERLMGKLSESFICVSELRTLAEKIPLYKELLARLSVIERETLKKIVGHLAFISSQKAKNKMSIQNLTMIWGPTLMQNHQSQEEMVYSQKEADVFADLITLYKNLFPLSPDEMKKEQEMLLCLQKYYAAAESLSDSVKKSGDLKVWITLNPNPENTTEEKTQVNVTISPIKTAYEICQELAPKMQLSTHQVTLHEVICNGNLERPLHHDTKIFDVVLNWSYWPEDDRKNNVLVVKPLDILNEVQRAVKNLATVTPGKELRFADNKTKSFKAYQCDLRDGKIVVSKKDKNDKTTIVREIFLHSTTAYLGCEKKRDVPWNWALTFVEKTQTQIMRSRDSPFIGHVLAGSEWVDRTIWYSSIWYCLHGDSILPPAEIIIK
ncbi:rhoGAP_ARAP and RA_ARAPs domain-containing protein RhoGAP15B isoform X2 [Musca autumnalis]|uniref:rhoGAP_ARAP and RA_ARAPs domain-containing protein RhoGAP15B isoform X2 n=1 Tax=Musca autumnalis TaxID=221902 RepID=UPI003CF108D9